MNNRSSRTATGFAQVGFTSILIELLAVAG